MLSLHLATISSLLGFHCVIFRIIFSLLTKGLRRDGRTYPLEGCLGDEIFALSSEQQDIQGCQNLPSSTISSAAFSTALVLESSSSVLVPGIRCGCGVNKVGGARTQRTKCSVASWAERRGVDGSFEQKRMCTQLLTSSWFYCSCVFEVSPVLSLFIWFF